MNPSRKPLLTRLIPLAVFFSGASALIYQTLWLRSFSLIFGGTTRAASLVIATFMGGLALGSHLSRKYTFRKVLPVYALAELCMGLTALGTIPLLKGLPSWYGGFLVHWPLPGPLEAGFRALLAALVVLPTTVLAGATIPLMLEFLTRQRHSLDSQFGRVYRLNTLGAAAGVVLSTFWFVPSLGMSMSLTLAAAGNLGVGALALVASSKIKEDMTPGEVPSAPPRKPLSGEKGLFPVHVLALGTGAAAFILEILWFRSFCLVLGSSVYAFDIMLLALLLGLALGTALYERWGHGIRRPSAWLAGLLAGLGLVIVLQTWVIGSLPEVWFRVMRQITPSFASHQAAGFLLCFLSLLPATVLQGLTFPLLLRLAGEDGGGQAQQASGKLYAWNTLGAILGSLGSGFFLVEAAGLQASFTVAALIPLALGLAVAQRRAAWPSGRKAASWGLLALASTLALRWYRPWNQDLMTSGVYLYGRENLHDVPAGTSYAAWLREKSPVRFYREGREALISVKQHQDTTFLQVNGKTDASSGRDTASQKLLGHLPFLLKPHAGRTLVIGWGSGATAASASLHESGLMDCAELEPATLEAAGFFDPVNFGLRPGGRLKLLYQDGRNVLLKSPPVYDVVISQPSNPWIHGVSNLFTLDFYQLVRSRLAPGGVFCQWLQYYQIGQDDLLSEFHTFCAAFPYVSLWLVPHSGGAASSLTLDCILLGSLEPQAIDFEAARIMMADPRVAADLEIFESGTPAGFLGNYVTDRQGLLEASSRSPLNTDDRPRLEFSAPRYNYLDHEASQELNFNNHEILDRAGAVTAAWPRGPWAGVAASGQAVQYFEWGKLSGDKGLYQRAEILLQRSVAMEPARGRAWLALGNARARRGDVAGAEKAWTEAQRRQPELKEALIAMGSLYYQQRDFQKCRETFTKVMRLFPREPYGYFGAGAAAANQGDLDAAEKLMKRCLELQPGHALALQFMERLRIMLPRQAPPVPVPSSPGS